MSILRYALFILIVLAIAGGMHLYLWARLVRGPALPAPWYRLASWGLIALGLLMVASMFLQRVLPHGYSVPVEWVAYTWLGVLFLLFVLCLGGEGVRLLLRLGAWARLDGLQGLFSDPARGVSLARWIAGLSASAALLVAFFGVISARPPIPIRRVGVELARWPEEMSGYTVVQISDLHVGGTIGKGFMEDVVRRVNDLKPDLVAITGDLVDGHVWELGPKVAPLAGLKARDGVYLVTGNHDFYSGAEAWVEFIRSLRIRVLRNERVRIGGSAGVGGADDRIGGGAGGFDLAGVEDLAAPHHGGKVDLPGALAGRDPSRAVILLAHQPRMAVQAAALGVDLQLSGHTHGGQVWPFYYLTQLFQPYMAGLYKLGDFQIYVSRGTGYWGPPIRVLARPEITRVEIVRPVVHHLLGEARN